MTAQSNEHWTPEGVMNWQPRSLSDEEKHCISELSGASDHEHRIEFISRIELSIGGYITAKSFFEGNTKKTVKGEINSLLKAAKGFAEKFDTLGEYSHQLLLKQGRGPGWYKAGIREVDGKVHFGAMPDGTPIWDIQKGFTVEEARVALHQLIEHADAILKFIARFQGTRTPGYAKYQLAVDTAEAFRDILGMDPGSTAKGYYEDTLREVLWCAGDKPKEGVDKDDRDVSGLVKYALEELGTVTPR